MAGYLKTTKKLELTVAGGATPTGRVWDAPCGVPVKDLNIYVSTRSQITGVGNLAWSVIYGGVWDGTPFAEGSTHSGGIVQTNGTIVGGTELEHRIYCDPSMFSTNLRGGRPGPSGIDLGIDGLPLVVYLHNLKKFDPLTVWVTFVTFAQGERV